jgi:hypothetical protein
MTGAPSRGDGLATAQKQEVTIAAAPGGAQSTWMKGHHRVGVKDFAFAIGSD